MIFPLKVLTLTQPWASLVGIKQIETRSWGTKYRGVLYIHASASFPKYCQALCSKEPFKSALARLGYRRPQQLPLGKIISRCQLVDVKHIISKDSLMLFEPENSIYPPAEPERSFGDYSPGRKAWFLADFEKLRHPIATLGKLSLWNYEQPLPLPDASINALEMEERHPLDIGL